MKHNFQKGFTLVELLVVMVIITILVGLMLPAVHQIREAARRSVCENNIRQLALACLNLEHNVGALPSGGWGPSYVGDPDMASGMNQPGSWLFAILPYIEQNDVYMQAADGNRSRVTDKQAAGALTTINMQIPTFLCSSRRTVKDKLPVFSDLDFINSNDVASPYYACKSDYAANSGSHLGSNSYTSGAYFLDADPRANTNIYGTQSSSWNPTWDTDNNHVNDKSDGVIHRRTAVRIDDITDGTSKTYLLGEKYVCPNFYLRTEATFTDTEDVTGTFEVIGDGRGAYAGCCDDNQRSAGVYPMQDTVNLRLNGSITLTKKVYTSSRGTDGSVMTTVTTQDFPYSGVYSPFGSAHGGSFGMALCDGSVHRVNYGLDPAVHSAMGTRNGSDLVNLSEVFNR
ncbi:MAG: DUF1559 domain-containing protein [Planctomycetia bacterium]|nr:DUF1559 domain-containing protein [Planctomycetia bacterium]